MLLELLFSAVLFVFFGYCLFYISTTVTVSTVSDPLGAAIWPQILIVLLLLMLALNMYHIVKKMPREAWGVKGFKDGSWKRFLTSPLFLGMAALLVYAAVLFLLFYKGMGIQMPRGTIPFLRNFALSVEKLLRSIG